MKYLPLLMLYLFISGCAINWDIYPLHTNGEIEFIKAQHKSVIYFMEVCHKQREEFYKFKDSSQQKEICALRAMLEYYQSENDDSDVKSCH